MRVNTGLLLLLLLGLPGALSGQSGLTLRVYGGIGVPTGDFGNQITTSPGAGGATLGYWAGAEAVTSLGTAGLDWVSTASVVTLGIDDAFAENFMESLTDVPLQDLESGRYWVLPVLTGLQYALPFGDGVLTPTGQVGLGITGGPSGSFVVTDGAEATEVESTYGTSTSFAFAVGLGMTVGDTLRFFIKYLSLGTPARTVELEAPGGAFSLSEEVDQSISMIQIGVGVPIN